MGKLSKSASSIMSKMQPKDKKDHPSVEVPDSTIDMKTPVQILNRGLNCHLTNFDFIS